MKKQKFQLDCALHNRFDIEVIDAITGTIRQRAQAENIICDGLWTRMFTPTSYFSYIHYGTGSGTPAASDTSLFTYYGYGSLSEDDDVVSYDYDNCFASLTRKTQLSETTAVGETITEVGIGYGSSSTSLATHAMLKDMNGNPISIEKTDTDIINIYATVFAHWSTSQYDSGDVEFFPRVPSDGKNSSYVYAFMGWLFGLGAWSTTYLSVWFNPGTNPNFKDYGTSTVNAKYRKTVTPTYDGTAKTMTITMERAAVADLNQADGWGSVQVGYSPAGSSSSSAQVYASGDILCYVGGSWYAGTEITGEAIATGDGTTTDFKTEFPLISGVTVKVDGVAVSSGLTIDTNKPGNLDNFGHNFKLIKYEVLPYDGSNPWGLSINPGGGFCDYDSTSQYIYGSPIRATYYNPYYALGLASMKVMDDGAIIETSDDNVTWTTVFTDVSDGTVVSVPSEYANYRYWRASHTSAGNQRCVTKVTTDISEYNLHFDTAPASGTVITADYTTKTIAKTTDYVFDFELVITLAEKTV